VRAVSRLPEGINTGFLERVHSRCSVLSAMLFAVVAPPDRRHIPDIPRSGDATTAEMIVLRTLQME